MPYYTVNMHFPDGFCKEDKEPFKTRSDAEAYALEWRRFYVDCVEIMNMVSQKDYPLVEETQLEFEIIQREEKK